MEESYCQRIVDGRLPELIPDTAAVPAAMALPVTTALGIGAYLGVPIRLKNGEVYGTFCCMNFSSKESLNERDLNVVRAFAEVVAFQIQRDFDQEQEKVDKIRRVRSVLQHGGLSVVYQPIYRVGDQRVEGLECLARFAIEPVRSPDVWFSEAFEVNLGVELEIAAIRAGLACFSALPPDVYVSVNASPATLLSPEFASALQSAPMNRIVLELTEHASISDYAEAMRALAPLRRNGLRLAVDDAGAGFSSFRHVLLLKPDLIKLDGSIIRQIDTDPDRRALAEALIGFGRAMGNQIIAECVETASELAAVRLLGVDHEQGYFFARPMALADVAQLLDRAAAAP